VGKIIFWIIVVFAVLLCLRLYNVAQQKRARKSTARKEAPKSGESMVRCARCGIYLPRSEAQLVGGEIRCRDPGCR
jgi:uncharacterized protein